MKKWATVLAALGLATVVGLGMTAAAAGKIPADAQIYADFETGPMAEPEGSMPASKSGGTLYINNGPINATASLSDGAMKLKLGLSGYYGMSHSDIQFRDVDGKRTSYKYLVIRMKGENGNENESGAGGLMMSIGGGDGTHVRTFLSTTAGTVEPFKDPDGKPMPKITKDYRDFVIALDESNVRVNPGKVVSGINFNNSVGNITLYIDEIYLTNTIPDGYTNDAAAATTAAPAPTTPPASGATQDGGPAPTGATPPAGNADGVIVTGSGETNLVLIIAVAAALAADIAALVLVVLKLPKKPRG